MKLRPFVKKYSIALVALATLSGVACENLQNGLKGSAKVPLLPLSLPIFPTNLTLSGLTSSLKARVDSLVPSVSVLGFSASLSSLLDTSILNSATSTLEGQLKSASLQILQPGTLSATVEGQLTDFLRNAITVSKVGINMQLQNNTQEFVKTPSQYKLFLGDGEKLKGDNFDESTSVPFEESPTSVTGTETTTTSTASTTTSENKGEFIVKPGDTLDVSLENVPRISV